MLIDQKGVTLASYSPRKLHSGRPQSHIGRLEGHDFLPALWDAASRGCALGLSQQPATEQPPPSLRASSVLEHRGIAAGASDSPGVFSQDLLLA